MTKVINFFTLYTLLLIFSACTKSRRNNITIPKNICKSNEIDIKFVEVDDLSSVLYNQKLANIYIKQQQSQLKSTINCYQDVINKLNS